MSAINLAPTDRTQRLLESAKQKLVMANVPPLLRMTAFLRLSCLALNGSITYSILLQKLCRHQNWWMTCNVTPEGTLKSSNAEINLLLAPINWLHEPQILPLAASVDPKCIPVPALSLQYDR
ncbi:MAG: hypothetical protein NW220_00550 [Leptolyngbyaceae cyanobacterium bins.349]|nr:hypothetical protein [Leptolyngbyaceae cyanobacterium bins.349]